MEYDFWYINGNFFKVHIDIKIVLDRRISYQTRYFFLNGNVKTKSAYKSKKKLCILFYLWVLIDIAVYITSFYDIQLLNSI